MKVHESTGRAGGFRILGAFLAVPLAIAHFAADGAPVESGDRAGADTARIEVTLREFAISPDPLRIPAGRPVTLEIRNDGEILHEFMAGRTVQEGDFRQDLFEGLHVNVSVMGEAAPEAGGHAHTEEGGHGDDEHGTMVTAEADQTVHMSFTLPESRRGSWTTACFLLGHYEAGMHGTLIVE